VGGHLVTRYPVLLGNDIERLAGTEERERILQSRAAASEDRLPESALGMSSSMSTTLASRLAW
jgi:hypothetical protein